MISETCYMCEQPATSREHVPPKCLFPEQKDLEAGQDLRKNLIRVPSCDTHNQEKSGDDEYLLFALTMSISNNQTAMTQIQRKIVRSITRNRSRFDGFARDPQHVFAVDPSGTAVDTLMVRIDNKRFLKSLDWIARGLFRHQFSRRFNGKCSLLPDFTLYAGSEDDVKRNDIQSGATSYVRPHFDELEQLGDNPEVFRYCFGDPDERGLIPMRMSFFDGSNVYVAYIPENTA